MKINELISSKKKIKKNIIVQNIVIEDKTFLHKKHYLINWEISFLN